MSTGKQLGQRLSELPLNPDTVLGLVCDTTSVNSGVGKKGGCCFWYPATTEAPCFIVMCRIHSQECIAGEALTKFNKSVYGSSNCEVGPSSTVNSLKTICFNLRELGEFIDFWEMDTVTQFCWPDEYEPIIDCDDIVQHVTGVQKLICLLISKKKLTKSDIAKKFAKVGVRWLGFFCSLLHVCLTIETVIARLEGLDDTELPSKTKVAVKDHTIKLLYVLRSNPIVMKQIYDFVKVHFLCWRKAVNCTGNDLFMTTLETSQMYARVGVDMGFEDAYFSSINRHLYNVDGVFLPLSTDLKCMSEVSRILKMGSEEGWEYKPAPFKTHLQYNFSKEELCDLDLDSFVVQPGFCKRTFCSPLFQHLDPNMNEICIAYESGNCDLWRYKSSLIPGHNQKCERLIGDLKRSTDIDRLVSISMSRKKRPRKNVNVNKGLH